MAISRQKETRSRNSYRMTSRVLYNAEYHIHNCTLQIFEQFGALYVHNLYDKIRPGRDSNPLDGSPSVMASTTAFHAIEFGVRFPVSTVWKKHVSSPSPRKTQYCDREVVCSASDARARISNPVSGGQCHLTYLTILRRLFLPNLAYMCTKGQKPDSLHFRTHYLWVSSHNRIECAIGACHIFMNMNKLNRAVHYVAKLSYVWHRLFSTSIIQVDRLVGEIYINDFSHFKLCLVDAAHQVGGNCIIHQI